MASSTRTRSITEGMDHFNHVEVKMMTARVDEGKAGVVSGYGRTRKTLRQQQTQRRNY